jgi:hypothetical protein
VNVQPFLIGDGWIEVRDGDPSVITLHRRHYSFQPRADGRRKQGLAVGPGFKLVLLASDGLAVCAWRQEKHRQDGQRGVECSIFRTEAGILDLASVRLAGARKLAEARWPGLRLFTFVDPRKVAYTIRAGRPTWGHCFYQDGWRFAGLTKRGLHILERPAP